MSEANSNSGPAARAKGDAKADPKAVQEKGLERMEALLRQSALGIHILFDNETITNSLKRKPRDDRELLDFDKMKKIQEIMTELVTKNTYYDKVDFLHALDQDSFDMMIRTYLHIVENTVRQTSEHSH